MRCVLARHTRDRWSLKRCEIEQHDLAYSLPELTFSPPFRLHTVVPRVAQVLATLCTASRVLEQSQTHTDRLL